MVVLEQDLLEIIKNTGKDLTIEQFKNSRLF